MRPHRPLSKDFYLHDDVAHLSRELLGKQLFTVRDGELTGGIIVETEAYCGVDDRASHAHKGRRTNRNEVMYAEGGVAYIYLCYGIHHLFNIVTNEEDNPQAILIRAVEPRVGIETMCQRRNKHRVDRTLAGGPGALTQALAISVSHNGTDLTSEDIWVEEGIIVRKSAIIASPRVGVSYAGEDALLPLRFRLKDSPWTSPAK